MIFEEQSTIEHMVFRILTHTQSLIQCQRVQVIVDCDNFSPYLDDRISLPDYCIRFSYLLSRYFWCTRRPRVVSLESLISRQMISPSKNKIREPGNCQAFLRSKNVFYLETKEKKRHDITI